MRHRHELVTYSPNLKVEVDMPLFLGMLSVMWFVAGGFMLVSGLDMMPRAFNILQQQYATGHLILAAVLLSFRRRVRRTRSHLRAHE